MLNGFPLRGDVDDVPMLAGFIDDRFRVSTGQ
jgi:hypothetical protein